jgi:hypothetical protein
MVGRRLQERKFHARTLQLKLRYKDFITITRARDRGPHPLDDNLPADSQPLSCQLAQGYRSRLLGASVFV